jgi:deoxyribonuclease V
MLSLERAAQIQEQLASRVRQSPLEAAVRLVAGADCSYSRVGTLCAAAVVVWDLRSAAVVETEILLSEARFPYVPGLLAFREAPAILKTLGRLSCKPQVLICDGHGIAHPRRFGLASHVGVLADLPTIGCAKSRLCGSYAEPASGRGSSSSLIDCGQTLGAVLRTRTGVRPVFVSVGHLIDLPAAVRVLLDCARGYRLPEPLRLAHLEAAAALLRELPRHGQPAEKQS